MAGGSFRRRTRPADDESDEGSDHTHNVHAVVRDNGKRARVSRDGPSPVSVSLQKHVVLLVAGAMADPTSVTRIVA